MRSINLDQLPEPLRGFSRKPPLIALFAFLYFLLPLSNLLYLILQSDLPARLVLKTLWIGIWQYQDPFLILTVLLWMAAPVIASGLYRVRLWAWYSFLVHAILMVFASNYRFDSGQLQFSPAFFLNVLVLLPAIFFLQKEIRRPYFNPRLRWWEQHPRLREILRVRLAWNEYVFEESTYDLAPDGIFVQTENLADVAVGYFFNITIYMRREAGSGAEDVLPIRAQGIVVWIQFEPGQNPCGYGIKFLGLADTERRRISHFIKAGLRAASTP